MEVLMSVLTLGNLFYGILGTAIGIIFGAIPGLSASGTMITVGMSRGLKHEFTVKFSLLAAIPAVCVSLANVT